MVTRAQTETERHRCEVRTLLRASANKGRAWVRDYLADKRVAGRAAALRADLNDQIAKGNTGEHGTWL
jgi:hypothetical protein